MIVLILGIFIVLLLSGVPVVAAMGLPALLYAIIKGLPPSTISYSLFQSLNSFSLVAIPMFILMGKLINEFHETERIFSFARLLLKNKKGYSARVNVIVSLIFSGISGAATADIGGLGQIEIRAMEREGFRKPYAAALTAASSIVGPIFPPSIPLIVFAITAEVSTLRALLAGALPGILITCVLYIFVTLQISRQQLSVSDRRTNTNTYDEITQQNHFLKIFLNAIPMIIAAPLILISMLMGVFSPSEAGVAGVLYVLFVEIVRGEFRFEKLKISFIETYHTVAGVLMIVAIASFFTKMLTLERFPELITTWFLNISHNPVIILLVINVVVLIVGMFIDTLSALLLLTPILLQITKTIGVDPLHLGVILVYNLMIGMFTPPLGIGVFTVAHVGKVAPDKVFRELVSLYIPLLISLLIITFAPKLTLWLPTFIIQHYR